MCGACVGVDGRVLGTNLLPFLASVKYGWSGGGLLPLKYQNRLHPHRNIVASDGDFRKKRQMSSILTEKKQYPMETFGQKSPNRLHPTRKSHKKMENNRLRGH